MEEKKVLRLCIDTCHVFAAGYRPMKFIETIVKEFGVGSIRLIHFNDSKDPCGCRVDHHAKVGQGYIGMLNLLEVLKFANLNSIDCVVE